KVKRQDRLLLILRTLACLLIVIAVARPVMRAGASKSNVIVLMDGTASMNQQVGVTTAFGLARRKAADILRALPEGTRATVGVFSEGVESLGDGESDLRAFADKIESVRPSEGADAASAGLNWVKEKLAGISGDAEVYIFSDFQKYTWLRNPELAGKSADALREIAG